MPSRLHFVLLLGRHIDLNWLAPDYFNWFINRQLFESAGSPNILHYFRELAFLAESYWWFIEPRGCCLWLLGIRVYAVLYGDAMIVIDFAFFIFVFCVVGEDAYVGVVLVVGHDPVYCCKRNLVHRKDGVLLLD